MHNRSRGMVDELVAEGATAASTPAVVAAQVDVVFTNLPDTPDVEKVVLSEKGIIEGAYNGLIYVDNSTIKPASARMLAHSNVYRSREEVIQPITQCYWTLQKVMSTRK